MSEKKSSFFGFFPSPASTNATPASQTEQKETSPQSASDSSSGSGSLSKFDYSILQPITVSNIITSVPKFDEHKLLGIDDGVEYLMIEENPMAALQLRKKEEGSFGPLPMRNNTDKMFYGCGAGYLAGLTSGGLYGFARGMSQSKSKLYRLRVNSVLNSVTRYGPRAGNSMGILTIFWAGLDTAISKLRDDKSDYFNHLSAAFLSGLIFKSTAGIKPALTAGVLMASAVGSYGVYEWVSDWLAKSRTQEPVWLDKVKTTASVGQ